MTWSGWAQQSNLPIAEENTAEDEAFAVFVQNFTSGATLGGNAILGLKWFFDGSYNAGSNWAGDSPKSGSGNYLNLDGTPFISELEVGNTTQDEVYTFLEDTFDLGYAVGLSVTFYEDTNFINIKTGGHTLTCWGYTYDANDQELTGLIITDSDDDQMNFNAGKDAPDRLGILDLTWDASGFYYTESFGADLNGYAKIEKLFYVENNSALYADSVNGIQIVGATSSNDFSGDIVG